jgi:cation-transporting ATPase E
MTGDGINDVLALKLADVGIAMGSGAAATRAVAELVLLDGRFATLPGVVAEGRRVTANIERVANLFLTKTVWAALLAVAASVALLPYPFLPRHLTIIDTLTIGIPSFFLALAPNSRRYRPGFVGRSALPSRPLHVPLRWPDGRLRRAAAHRRGVVLHPQLCVLTLLAIADLAWIVLVAASVAIRAAVSLPCAVSTLDLPGGAASPADRAAGPLRSWASG